MANMNLFLRSPRCRRQGTDASYALIGRILTESLRLSTWEGQSFESARGLFRPSHADPDDAHGNVDGGLEVGVDARLDTCRAFISEGHLIDRSTDAPAMLGIVLLVKLTRAHTPPT